MSINNTKKYWDAMLEDALKEQEEKDKKTSKKPSRGKTRKYPLGDKYEGIYLSQREAECITCMIMGKTGAGAAKKLGISPRTVEFYVSNMKKKLNCTNKFDLIEKIIASDFSLSLWK